MEKEKRERIKNIFFAIISRVFLVITGMLLVPFLFNTQNVPSPSDFIQEADIIQDYGKVCILGEFVVARISDTKSMDPTMDNTSIVLAKEFDSLDDVSIGDIIAYDDGKHYVVHRIISKGEDYVVVRGDNNAVPDRYRIYENQIKRVVVGILY